MRILIDPLPVTGTGGHLLLLADDVECGDAVLTGDHYKDHPGCLLALLAAVLHLSELSSCCR